MDSITIELTNINQRDSELFNNINLRTLDSSTINDIGECYCCQEDTNLRSPCICRTHICDSCLITYVKYNDKCTICNSYLDIYVPTPTSTISNRTLSFNLTYSFENENIVGVFDILNIVKYIYYLYYAFCLIHYCGIFTLRQLYNENYYSYDLLRLLEIYLL